MSKPRVLGLVAARGGSKGIPGKNLRPFLGRPLVAHAVAYAGMCPEISRVIVSSDSQDIVAAAVAAGAEAPFLRPAELARDDTPMWPVVRHAVRTLADAGDRYDMVALLDATTPCRLPADMTAAVAALSGAPEADGVIGVSRPDLNPLWNCWLEEGGRIRPASPASAAYARRQDAPVAYHVNAALYLWRTSFVERSEKTWRDGVLLPHEIPEHRVIHIDDAHQFRRAEILVEAGYIELPWLTPQEKKRP